MSSPSDDFRPNWQGETLQTYSPRVRLLRLPIAGGGYNWLVQTEYGFKTTQHMGNEIIWAWRGEGEAQASKIQLQTDDFKSVALHAVEDVHPYWMDSRTPKDCISSYLNKMVALMGDDYKEKDRLYKFPAKWLTRGKNQIGMKVHEFQNALKFVTLRPTSSTASTKKFRKATGYEVSGAGADRYPSIIRKPPPPRQSADAASVDEVLERLEGLSIDEALCLFSFLKEDDYDASSLATGLLQFLKGALDETTFNMLPTLEDVKVSKLLLRRFKADECEDIREDPVWQLAAQNCGGQWPELHKSSITDDATKEKLRSDFLSGTKRTTVPAKAIQNPPESPRLGSDSYWSDFIDQAGLNMDLSAQARQNRTFDENYALLKNTEGRKLYKLFRKTIGL